MNFENGGSSFYVWGSFKKIFSLLTCFEILYLFLFKHKKRKRFLERKSEPTTAHRSTVAKASPMKICRSKRPGRSRAGSRMSGRLVPAKMTTFVVVLKPGGRSQCLHEEAWAAETAYLLRHRALSLHGSSRTTALHWTKEVQGIYNYP